jgi:altronate hydrolase
VHADDNVAIVLVPQISGSMIDFFDLHIKLHDDVSVGDRISIIDIEKNTGIYQYGSKFALAKEDIPLGRVISSDLIIDDTQDIQTLDLSIYAKNPINLTRLQNFAKDFQERTFLGYKREDGLVGTRNYYVIMPTSFCATDIANKLSVAFDTPEVLACYENIDGIVSAGHTEGCGCSSGDIIERLLKVIKNTILHPNCGGALIVDLGCEKTNYSVINKYLGDLEGFGKPIDFITIQELGGTTKTLEKGRLIIESRLNSVNSTQRERCLLNSIVLGTECGASDSFSGITANPLIGAVSDNIVDLDGQVILSEVPEMLGAEEILLHRMPNIETREKFVHGVSYYQNMAKNLNVSMSGNLVAGNLKGGLVNLTLKSLGSIQKGGSREIVDFVDYGSKVTQKGLNIMNGPGNDFESVTGITASGANLFLFSTGMGTTEGSLICPIIKVASNTKMYTRLSDDMDFNAGKVLDGDGLGKATYELMELVIKVASGEVKTASERHKKRAFQIWSVGKLSL